MHQEPIRIDLPPLLPDQEAYLQELLDWERESRDTTEPIIRLKWRKRRKEK